MHRQCQDLGIEGFAGELGREEIRSYIEQVKEAMAQLSAQAERVKVRNQCRWRRHNGLYLRGRLPSGRRTKDRECAQR